MWENAIAVLKLQVKIHNKVSKMSLFLVFVTDFPYPKYLFLNQSKFSLFSLFLANTFIHAFIRYISFFYIDERRQTFRFSAGNWVPLSAVGWRKGGEKGGVGVEPPTILNFQKGRLDRILIFWRGVAGKQDGDLSQGRGCGEVAVLT